MRITVIGCGNSGLIHAAKLLENNIEVGILKTSNAVNDIVTAKLESKLIPTK